MIWLCILLGRWLPLILSALTRFNRAIKGKVFPIFRSMNDVAMALDMIKIELLRLELLRQTFFRIGILSLDGKSLFKRKCLFGQQI